MEERPYGNTGEKFPILSFGAMHLGGIPEADAVKLVNYAIVKGIRYFDTAFWYGDGQSEERLGKAFGPRRKDIWIATKTMDRTRRGARKQLETSLKRLRTDHVDEWRMHYVWSYAELDKITAPGGALEAAVKAREEGLVRFISISNHGNPGVQVEALKRFPFDSMLFPVSVLDRFILSFVDEVLPAAKAKGVAVAGMKILALGRLSHIYDRALRYAFGLPIDTAVVGIASLDDLRRDLKVAENYRPLDDEERLSLYKEVLPLVTPENMPWKAEDWNNPVEWRKRT